MVVMTNFLRNEERILDPICVNSRLTVSVRRERLGRVNMGRARRETIEQEAYSASNKMFIP